MTPIQHEAIANLLNAIQASFPSDEHREMAITAIYDLTVMVQENLANTIMAMIDRESTISH